MIINIYVHNFTCVNTFQPFAILCKFLLFSFESVGFLQDDSCSETRMELKQTLSSVYDPAVADIKEGAPEYFIFPI